MNVFDNFLAAAVNKFVIYQLIKLTKLWTTRALSGKSADNELLGHNSDKGSIEINIFPIHPQKYVVDAH